VGTPTVAEARQELLRARDSGALAALCRAHDVDLMVLFGSAAFAPTAARDLDLAVAGAVRRRLDPIALLQALYELTGFEGFDLLNLRTAGAVARERALVAGEVLHQEQPGIFASMQIRAIMERLDTEHLRRVQLELMRDEPSRHPGRKD
jgi:hypothetical protein